MSCVVDKRMHQLMDIMTKPHLEGDDGYLVVRWCQSCGAVVIDVDVDGRTHPGGQMAMTFPSLAFAEQHRQLEAKS